MAPIRSFASSTVVYARRTKKDDIDLNNSETYDDQEEADEEEEDTDQVRCGLHGIAIGFFFPDVDWTREDPREYSAIQTTERSDRIAE